MKKAILIVDDDRETRNCYKGVIEDNFYTSDVSIVMGTSGEDGWREFQESQPELVITDLRMEEPLAGLELAKRTKEVSAVPVIMITAESDFLGDVKGIDCVLAKPPDEEVLAGMIAKFLFS